MTDLAAEDSKDMGGEKREERERKKLVNQQMKALCVKALDAVSKANSH